MTVAQGTFVNQMASAWRCTALLKQSSTRASLMNIATRMASVSSKRVLRARLPSAARSFVILQPRPVLSVTHLLTVMKDMPARELACARRYSAAMMLDALM